MGKLKKSIRKIIRLSGFDIVRYRKRSIGLNPFLDMQHFLRYVDKPVILDVGANVGQSVDIFKAYFEKSRIYSCEPSPDAFTRLKDHCRNISGVTTYNFGIGSKNETLTLRENTYSDMSSFLKPNIGCWGVIHKLSSIPVITLDSFTKEQSIKYIHILKTDTQGFDLEVLRGGASLIKEHKIGLVFIEITFSSLYKDQPKYYDVLRFLANNNFVLVSFYDLHFQGGEVVGWTNALYINRELLSSRQKV